MLQINSGKLFTRGVGRTNHLRGVLYSNLQLCYGYDVVTAAGTLRETDGGRGSRAIVFEIDERIEAEEIGPGVLISHTIAPFLQDFSAVATFGLKAIVSPDATLIDRLASKGPGLASYHPPRQFVGRYFDDQVSLKQEDIAPFAAFIDQLIALDRKTFLAAMRAIRTFVSGLYRIRDDLALAYTLFVSAVESLAQDFDGYVPTWEDVDERKRKPVDRALGRASIRTAVEVRNAILSSEHASLARRYRSFMLSHIDGSFFRNVEGPVGSAIARPELEEALRQAYALRSRYVHNLRVLPDALTLPHEHWEMTAVDRKPTLTFQGLVRLTHHAIMSFVANGRVIKHEPYHYTNEQSGVVMMQLAAEMWVGSPLKKAQHARQRLEGFLEQITLVLSGASGAKVTDLRPIFPDIEQLLKSGPAAHRPALIALYALFSSVLPKDERPQGLGLLVERYAEAAGAPSCEALIARMLFGTLDAWTIEQHQLALDRYFAGRSKPTGLHAPRIINAALSLALAERYRRDRQPDRARELVSQAIESCPGHPALLALEQAFKPRSSIKWQAAVLPRLVKPTRKKRAKRERSPDEITRDVKEGK